MGLDIVGDLAKRVDAPEPAIRLLISVLLGYPIAIVYTRYIVKLNVKNLEHLYFASLGILLYYFNFKKDTYHSLIAIGTSYALTVLFRKTPTVLVVLNFIFNMSYLMVGYYFNESNQYDILWTTPHCVLTLRLIGFGFDIYDGTKKPSELSAEQKEHALNTVPSFLSVMAFAYFPSAFLIGPQFPYRRYEKFINGDFRNYTGNVKGGLQRFIVGVFYLIIRQIGARYVPDEYFLSQEYLNEPFIMRLYYLGFWGKMALYKYISCWLLTEGALIMIGFTYNGQTASGKSDWTGCSNVKLLHLETGNTMYHYVQSFNVNTNQWLGQYVYKRLKFLNNRHISYAGALLFLAVWHGFHSGYYLAFFIEFSIVTVERQMDNVYTKDILPEFGYIENNIPYKIIKFIVLKSYNLIYMGWCLTPFIFLSYDRYTAVMSAVNYFGFVHIGSWLILNFVFQRIKRRRELQRVSSNITEANSETAELQSDHDTDKYEDIVEDEPTDKAGSVHNDNPEADTDHN